MKNNKKILTIDDDPTITALLKKRLTANFFDVVSASNGREGLEKYKKENPDLIILDVQMPVMDGYSFVLEFKQIADLKETPIIMLSAMEQMSDIFKIEGINDFVVKPFRMSELLDKINKHLESHNKRILIVDDEEGLVHLIDDRLALCGYQVSKAFNGQDGLQLAQKENPDLILLDIMMPKLDGFNFCRMLKFDQKYKDIVIVLLTARAQDADKYLGEEVRADAFMTKPFEANDLLLKLKELLWD